MSENFAERLKQFTPDAGGLDRDALLIAVGRASARPNRLWMVLAGLLASSQIVTLFVLWPKPIISTLPIEAPFIQTEQSQPPTETDPSSWWMLQGRGLDTDGDISSAPSLVVIPVDPPLHAFAQLPVNLLN